MSTIVAAMHPISAQDADTETDRLFDDTQRKAMTTMAEPEFTRSARRPVAVVEGPMLQWASGLQTTDKRIYAGWLIEAGKLLDLDTCLADDGFQQVTIKHGNGNIVTHWAIETANVFIIADGVQTPAEMRRSDQRFGIAYGWRTLDTGRRQSQLKARVFLRELLLAGYTDPLTLTVKSTLTDDVLNAFMRQYDVLNAVDGFRQDDKKPVLNAPLYACALPLAAGAEVVRGTGANTKEIAPPIADVPSPITKEYIRANWIKRDWTARIEAIIDATIQWSIDESQRITAGAPERAAA